MALWAIGRFDLHLSEDEYNKLTLTQFNALMDRFQVQQERQDYRAGLICAVLANIYRDPGKSKPFTTQDFMLGQRREQHKQTPEQMLNAIKSWQHYYEVKEHG